MVGAPEVSAGIVVAHTGDIGAAPVRPPTSNFFTLPPVLYLFGPPLAPDFASAALPDCLLLITLTASPAGLLFSLATSLPFMAGCFVAALGAFALPGLISLVF